MIVLFLWMAVNNHNCSVKYFVGYRTKKRDYVGKQKKSSEKSLCVTDVTTPVARKRGGHRSVFLAIPTLGHISQVCDFRLTSGKKQCGLETLRNALPERRKSVNHSFKLMSRIFFCIEMKITLHIYWPMCKSRVFKYCGVTKFFNSIGKWTMF